MQTGGGIGDGVAPHHQVAAGLNDGVGGEYELPYVAVVGEAPVRDVDRSRTRVVEFHPIRIRPGMIDRGLVLGHEFVEQYGRRWRRGIGLARRSADGGAGLPIGGGVRVSVRIDHLQGIAVAVRGGRPAAPVVVVHGGDQPATGAVEGDALAAVAEVGREPACRGDPRITRVPCIGVGIGSQHQPFAGAQQGACAEGEFDAAKRDAPQVEGGRGEIGQLDEFVERAARGVVHDLRDAQRDAQGGMCESRLHQRAPARPLPRPRLDRDGIRQRHRPRVGARRSRYRSRPHHARVAAVERVVNRAARMAHAQLKPLRDPPAMLLKPGRLHRRQQALGRTLAQVDRQAVASPVQDRRIHIRNQCREFSLQFLEPIGDILSGKRASVIQMPLYAIGPQQLKLRAFLQSLVDACDGGLAGHARVVGAAPGQCEDIQGDRSSIDAHGPFCVPECEAPDPVRRLIPARAPIVVGPIPHGCVGIQQHVIDVIGEIQPLGDGGVIRWVRGIRGVSDVIEHGLEVVPVPIHDLAPKGFGHIPFGPSPQVLLKEILVYPFAWVVDGRQPRRTRVVPILAVDEYHRHGPMRGDLPHVVRQPPAEFVPDKGIALLIESASKDNPVEALDGGQREQRIGQAARTVVAPEVQSKRELAVRGEGSPVVIAALQANAAIDLEAVVVIRFDPLDGSRAFPGESVVQDVIHVDDAARPGEVCLIGDDRHDGDGADVRRHVEEVAVRGRLGREIIVLECGGAQEGGAVDGGGGREDGGGRPGFRAVGGEANDGPRGGARQDQIEGGGEEPAPYVHVDGLHHPHDGARAIGGAWGRGREVAEVPGGVRPVGDVVALLRVGSEAGGHYPRRIRRVQPEMFAGGVELEVGVPLPVDGAPALAGGEDHPILPGRQGCLRQRPEARDGRVVAERPAGQMDRFGPVVVDLDPILRLAVLVEEAARSQVGGEDLGDAQIVGGQGGIQGVPP